MKTIIIIAILFTVYKLITSVKAHREEKAREEAEYQRQTDAATLRQEWREMQEKAKQDVLTRQAEFREQERQRKLAELDREALWKEQDRLWKEQERQAKEQERQSAEMEKMRHVLEQATADIDFLQDRTADLYAQLDYQLLLQAGTVPGSKQFEKYQSKIVTLKNQIHTAENKLSKAQWNRDTAQRKLA